MFFRLRRPIRTYDIISRKKKSALALASSADFVLRRLESEEAVPTNWPGIAYCFSLWRKQLFLTAGGNPASLLQAPFLYIAQFEAAERVIAIPFPRLPEMDLRGPARPVFIFSPGRCGSTLLAALLKAAGAGVLSEPDFMTQLATLKEDRRFRTNPQLMPLLIRSGMASFCAHWGENLVLKLRGRCNVIADEIAGQFPGALFVVMLRDRLDWARSHYGAFGGKPEALANTYAGTIRMLDTISNRAAEPVLIHYEDLRANPIETVRRLQSAGVRLNPDFESAIALIVQRDSQENTPLAKSERGRRPISDEWLTAFECAWQRIKPDDVLTRHALARLR
jgi:hypothetical protein